MSSILKALKKLEDEKSIRKPDSLKIDAEILRGDASRRFSPMGVSLLAALLFVCGGGATYVFMKPDKGNSAGMKSSAAAVAPSSSGTAVVPVDEKQRDVNIQAEFIKLVKIIPARSDQKPDKYPPSSVKSPGLHASDVPLIKQSEQKQPVVAARKEPTPAIRPSAPVMAPQLKVNGIAFQEESVDRVAIVNGISVSNGSMIEGARVEDIQKNLVRFSYGGKTFDVALGKSNR